MMGRDYEIDLYAAEGPDVPGATLIPCLTNEERIGIFGADDPGRLPAWPTDAQSALFNQRVIEHMIQRLKPHDLILFGGGRTHKPIADAFPSYLGAEPFVGYPGILQPYCAFESYAWMHSVYAWNKINDGRWFDTVIPNYFDPDDFPLLNDGKGDYLLFLGRVVLRKGPHIAAEIARGCGMKLKIAGAGVIAFTKERVVAPEVIINGSDLEYVGTVNIEQRAKLLAGARALLVPTTYIEPFGGVAVEAMMAGTPVIATDWGAFTETVCPGVSGYRFKTLQEGIAAVKNVVTLEPEKIRRYAMERYSLDAVRPQFDRWFKQLDSLWRKGWYELDVDKPPPA
jgi:glycosyltransferase involved in cell wall biosynthesis